MKKFLALALITLTLPASADNGPVVVYFPSNADVVGTLSNMCIQKGVAITEQDEHHVLCSRQMSGFSGALAQWALGNSYSTTPVQSVRFSITKLQNYTVVQATQWVETQMAFGQIRRQELDGKKQKERLLEALQLSGGLLAPPLPPSTPSSETNEPPANSNAAPKE